MDRQLPTGNDDLRDVGGELVSGLAVDSRSTHVEVLRRRSTGPIDWRFRQRQLALFWFRNGVSKLHLDLDGRQIHADVTGRSNLALFPASMYVEGEFEVGPHCDYAVVFLDAKVAGEAGIDFDRPLISFQSDDLQRSLAALCREAHHADSLYELFAEGWAMQALAVLARIGGAHPIAPVRRGGLAASSLRRVTEYVAADLSRPFTIQLLAEVAGVSPRHFIRTFQESTGLTPLRFVQEQRIAKAKQLLAEARRSATDIALECGFSHAQHFSTAFKNATGVTPSTFRRSTVI